MSFHRLGEKPKFLVDFNVVYSSSEHPHWRGRENYPKPEFDLTSVVNEAIKILTTQTNTEVLHSFELIKLSFWQDNDELITLILKGVIGSEIGASREAHAKMTLPNDADARMESIMKGISLFSSEHRKILDERLAAVSSKKRALEGIISHF